MKSDVAASTIALASMSAVVSAALPLSAFSLGTRVPWWIPLGVGALIATARVQIRRTAKRRIREHHFRPPRSESMQPVESESRTDRMFLAVAASERLALDVLPALIGSAIGVLVALACAARFIPPLRIAVFACASGGLLFAAGRWGNRPSGDVERLIATRGRVSALVAAMARETGELGSAAQRDYLARLVDHAVEAWIAAESALERRGRRTRALLLGIVATGAILLTGATSLSALAKLAADPLGILHAHLRTIALLGAALTPATLLVTSLDEAMGLRAQRALLGRFEPVVAAPTRSLPSGPIGFEAESLCVRFDGVEALNVGDARFVLSGLVAIVGPNGTGKSTLAKLLCGTLMPTKGTLLLAGVPPSQIDRSDIAYVAQDPVLVESLTVEENLRLVAAELPAERLSAALTKMGLDVGLARACGTLSRGEQRRIALARAFLKDARIIVLDEPDAWLDVDGRARLSSAIDEERSGKVFVLVTHRSELAARADLAIVLGDDHRIASAGPAHEVMHPSHDARPDAVHAPRGGAAA